jgi:hypothetical protein
MNALMALCNAGGTIRINVFRNFYTDNNEKFLATVIVSCTLFDKAELISININSIKGVLKKNLNSGKLSLDLSNSKDPELPNFWFGTGFSDYINAETIKKIVDHIPDEKNSRKFIEFIVLEDGTIKNVDPKKLFIKKRIIIAENMEKLLNENCIEDEILISDQIDIDSIIMIKEKDSVYVTS